eukprot:51458-Chlamydomonas_euryale.AAC.3
MTGFSLSCPRRARRACPARSTPPGPTWTSVIVWEVWEVWEDETKPSALRPLRPAAGSWKTSLHASARACLAPGGDCTSASQRVRLRAAWLMARRAPSGGA